MEVIVATKDGVTAKIEGTVPVKWATHLSLHEEMNSSVK
jgi:hypothetical protein